MFPPLLRGGLVLVRFPAANSGKQLQVTVNRFQARAAAGTVDPVRKYSQLAEVGKLEPLKEGNYDTGQMFLHRLFGYRGVVLFPWTARVYDRDSPPSSNPNGSKMKFNPPNPKTANNPLFVAQNEADRDSKNTHTVTGGAVNGASKEVKGKTHTYYQVLIDSRDCPFITHRAQTESVTFLGNHSENTRNLYAIPGLDYVGHEDVLPYSTADTSPIQHELFDKFLAPSESAECESSEMTTWGAQETLRAWQEKNHPWLELSDVHRETTENIRVTVIPFYMGYRENQANNVYWWRYCIRLENLGTQAVQLRERNWRIFSLSGTLETVRGRGVVGQEPMLTRDQPAFQYSSHVSLQAPSGHMWGTFRMEREDGYSFDCRIPPFSLESKQEDPSSTGGTGPVSPTEPFTHG